MPIELQGHIHPESSFATISQWEDIASQFLALQAKGKDTRGGVIQDDPALAYLVNRWFGFQLNIETKRFAPGVTDKALAIVCSLSKPSKAQLASACSIYSSTNI